MSDDGNLSEFNRFMENNREFLHEKYQEYFGGKGFTLNTVPHQAIVDYIGEVFSLNRFKDDQATQQRINQSLLANVGQYIDEQIVQGLEEFRQETVVQALTFTARNNSMFDIQYDIETTANTPQGKEQKVKREHKIGAFNVELKGQGNGQGEKVKEVHAKNVGQTSHGHYADSYQHANTNVSHYYQRRAGIEEGNEFDQHPDKLKLSSKTDLLKRNAKMAFLTFCKNQMELGGKRTFDNLQEEASTMTIGKLLVYSKAYDVLGGKITRELLMQRFKRISQGKRVIDFEKFYVLLVGLSELDPSLFMRLQFYDPNLYKKMKFVKNAFYTQDPEPRETVAKRRFSNKLTSHSGKTPQQLKEQLKLRHKDLHQYTPLVPTSIPRPLPKRDKLSPKDLSSAKHCNFSVQLSFIDKIVSPEQNDQRYLGDLQLQHQTRQDLPTYASGYALRRKDHIVEDIRKRIKQIEHGQISTRLPPRARFAH